jgi:hypothetical protein
VKPRYPPGCHDRLGTSPLTWAVTFERVTVLRAGDGNRTRTISLGIRPIGTFDRPDLDIRRTTSDRHGPRDTRANGTPMARLPALAAQHDPTPASGRHPR